MVSSSSPLALCGRGDVMAGVCEDGFVGEGGRDGSSALGSRVRLKGEFATRPVLCPPEVGAERKPGEEGFMGRGGGFRPGSAESQLC